MGNSEYRGQRRITAWSAISREFKTRCPDCGSLATKAASFFKMRCKECNSFFDRHKNINLDDISYRDFPYGQPRSFRWTAEEKGFGSKMNSAITQQIAVNLDAYTLEIRSQSGPWCENPGCPCVLHVPPDTSRFIIAVKRGDVYLMLPRQFNHDETIEFADSFDEKFPPA